MAWTAEQAAEARKKALAAKAAKAAGASASAEPEPEPKGKGGVGLGAILGAVGALLGVSLAAVVLRRVWAARAGGGGGGGPGGGPGGAGPALAVVPEPDLMIEGAAGGDVLP